MTPTLENIWHEFAVKLGQFIRARVADPATAEDILQDVFVKIQARRGSLEDPAKLQGRLYLRNYAGEVVCLQVSTPSR